MTATRRAWSLLALTGATLLLLLVVAIPRASADPCVVDVTLVGGQTLTFNVDVPPNTPVSSLNLPITGPVASETMTCTTTTSSSSSSTTTTTTTTSPTTTTTSTTSSSTSTSPSRSTKPPKKTTTTTTTKAPKPSSKAPEKSSTHKTKATTKPATHHAAKPKHKSTSSLPSGKGVPNAKNPTYSLSLPGAAPIGVPNFFIDSFQIPPFLIPIYQAAGIEYQVPWQVLAAINEIETDYGRNLSVSSAGAVGWMQFLPSTWKQWGVDATGNGVADPYNPVDAIFTAARYLHATGASTNLAKAIFSYNHANWYVQSVLLRAKLIGGIPSQLVGSLTSLVQGHFPVAAPAKYADDSVVWLAKHRVKGSNAAIPISSDASKGTSIFAKQGSPVIAVNDGKIVKVGETRALGHYIVLQDATGNTYTYSQLGSVSKTYPVPKPVRITARDIAQELAAPKVKAPKTAASAGRLQAAQLKAPKNPKVIGPASAGTQSAGSTSHSGGARGGSSTATGTATGSAGGASSGATNATSTSGGASTTSTPSISTPLVKERLFANPSRPSSYAAGGNLQLKSASQQVSSFENYFSDVLHLNRSQYTLKPLKAGSIVVAGTILGRIGGISQGLSSHLYFQVQPAGRKAPYIDPKPILDGWKLLEATAVYRAANVDPFYGPDAKNPTVGQVLLMSKQQLTERVLTDPHVQIYNCGRRDIQTGQIDRRVLATIEFLSASGLDPYVSGLKCGAANGAPTGTDAQGKTGDSVDISKINNIPIAGNQGPGSITDVAIRRLLTLQGAMQPDEIISDTSYKSQPNTLALPDHQNRLQILFTSYYGTNGKLSGQVRTILQPGQWAQLINRIGEIPEPVVPITPSKYAIRRP